MKKASRDSKSLGRGVGSRAEAVQHAQGSGPLAPKRDDLPSPETLSLVAASLFRLEGVETPRKAVELAFQLYENARVVIGERRVILEKDAGEAARLATVPIPPRFPASLDDFLRIIVNAPTISDATRRFREYLCQCEFALDGAFDEWTKVEKRMKAEGKDTGFPKDNFDERVVAAFEYYKREGYKTKEHWQHDASHYPDAWKWIKSCKARESAKSRKWKIKKSP